jgi:hypothetical protein
MTEHNTLTETDIAERAAFLATCDAGERADAESVFRLIDEHANRPTVIPPSYDALTAEVYNILTDFTDRDTIAPPPSRQMDLELACAGLDLTW